MLQYLDLLDEVLANGVSYKDRTGVGRTGVWQRTLRFDLRERFPILTTKKIPLRWVFEELMWFLSGSTYEPHLAEKGVDIWKEWSSKEKCTKFNRPEGELGPVYGGQFRSFGATEGSCGVYPRYWNATRQLWHNYNYLGGVDQVEKLITGILANPYSTRHMVSLWDPASCDDVELPPCHVLFHVKVWPNGYLSSYLYQRSCDVFLGVPFNISSYALFTCMIAHVCNLQPYEFVHQLGDCHIYHNHMEQVEEQLGRTPRELPQLVLDGKLKGSGLKGLLGFRWEDVQLVGYDPMPAIKAPIAV